MPEDALVRQEFVSLTELIGFDGALGIDPAVLAARLDSPAPRPEGPLVVIGDGREVRLHGQVFRFQRGIQCRRIVVLLYKRHLLGQDQVPSAEIIAELELRADARIRDYFKTSDPSKSAWNRLLTEENGMCRFCL